MTERVVAVAGGGVSGLATAEAILHKSAAAGVPTRVIVLESESAPGGKIRSSRESGFVVETGPHGFLDKEPKMFELIDRLDIRGELIAANVGAARRFIMREGKLREVPSSPPGFILSDILPLTGKLRVGLEPFMGGPPEGDESVRDFAARRIGPQAADVLVDAMVTGIYGGDPRRLSLRSAFPRMFELERDHGSLIKAQLAIAKEKKKLLEAGEHVVEQKGTGAPTGTLHSFKEGLSTLIDALAGRVEIRCEESVQSIERVGHRWRLHGRSEIDADALVSTVPAYVAEPLLAPHAPAIAERIGRVPYVACSVVVQAFHPRDVRRSAEGFGFLVPGGEKRDVLGTIWASTVFPEHVPEGMIMFRSMLGGARRPDLAHCSEEELARRARKELEELMGVDPKAQPLLQRVIPWPKAIPQYEVGHAAKVEAADAIERELPGVFLSGNAFRGVAVLACVSEADRIAERVLTHVASLPATNESDSTPYPRGQASASL